MAFSCWYKNLTRRIFFYIKKHGILNFLLLAGKKIYRTSFNNRVIIYYYDYDRLDVFDHDILLHATPYNSFESIPESDLNTLYNIKGSKSVIISFFERFFSFKATLWLAKYNNTLVGYHWSLRNGFNGFYNVPITDDDVVLAASEILPDYRGKGYNNMMIYAIVRQLVNDGSKRFFIGSAVWNKSQIKSLSKSFFKTYGIVKKYEIFGRYITIWNKKDFQRQMNHED